MTRSLDHIPFANLPELFSRKIEDITTRKNNVLKGVVVLDVLEDDLPTFPAWLLRSLFDCVCACANCVRSGTKAAVHRTD